VVFIKLIQFLNLSKESFIYLINRNVKKQLNKTIDLE